MTSKRNERLKALETRATDRKRRERNSASDLLAAAITYQHLKETDNPNAKKLAERPKGCSEQEWQAVQKAVADEWEADKQRSRDEVLADMKRIIANPTSDPNFVSHCESFLAEVEQNPLAFTNWPDGLSPRLLWHLSIFRSLKLVHRPSR